jgi:site-specific recombinase
MKAGIFIAVFAVIKIFMDTVELDVLGKTLWYSINYALCFVLVKIFGGIIATKQPAMTASSIIKKIDKNNDLKIESIHPIVELYRHVTKSQLTSFVGNVCIALPLAYLMGKVCIETELIELLSDKKIHKLVEQSYPIEGGAIIYASIAGVFLAMSGLISGYVDNKIIYTKLPYRIRNHQFLNRVLSKSSLVKMSDYLEKKSGVLAGNIGLGFLLGSAPLIQSIIQIPFDIRHIAFSSANFGFALSAESFNNTEITYGILGVFLIGFFNFFFSFSLTLFLALKSRSIELAELFTIFGKCGLDVMYHPKEYIPFLHQNYSR